MKKIKLEFSVSTNIYGSRVSEIVEIEVEEDSSEDEIEKSIEEEFDFWLGENIDTNWEIIK
jgi:hypothetical protein